MANNSRGKKFEQRFKEDFKKIPESFILRLPDQVSGWKATSANVCDFIGYVYPRQYLLECKSFEGNTFPFSSFRQYEKLVSVGKKKGQVRGAVLWFVTHKKIVFVPIETFEQLKAEGKKSFNIKMVGDPNYDCIEIPTEERIVFLTGDYSVLLNYKVEK